MHLTIDRGFKPVVYDYAGKYGQTVLDGWGMPREGVPVAALATVRAAVWGGTTFNNSDETLALLVSVERTTHEPSITAATYYFGLATRSAVDAVPEKQQAEIFADAAIHQLTLVSEETTPLRVLFDVVSSFAPPPITT